MSTDLRLEWWLAQRVSQPNLPMLFQGVTDVAERCARLRAEIRRQGVAEGIAGGLKRGEPRTFAECFEHIYGEPL